MTDTPYLPARSVPTFWQDTAPRLGTFLFAAFVALGAVFIFGAKFAGLANWILTVVPVAIMLTYAVLSRIVPSMRLRDDQTGDNLYYMGFIFTLTSLAVALYRFQPETGFDEIVRNFGIAISSTIAGIVLRILFNQLRQDPLEIEHVARRELAEAARRTRQQLDETVIAFNHFHTGILQSLDEAQQSLRQRLQANVEELTTAASKPLQRAAENVASVLDSAVDGLSRSVERGASGLDQETGRMSQSVLTLQNSLNALNAKLTEMQTPERVIAVQVAPVVAALQEAVREFDKRDQRHVAEFTQALERFLDRSQRSGKRRWLWWRTK